MSGRQGARTKQRKQRVRSGRRGGGGGGGGGGGEGGGGGRGGRKGHQLTGQWQAKGHREKDIGNLKQAGEKVKDAFRKSPVQYPLELV